MVSRVYELMAPSFRPERAINILCLTPVCNAGCRLAESDSQPRSEKYFCSSSQHLQRSSEKKLSSALQARAVTPRSGGCGLQTLAKFPAQVFCCFNEK